MTDSPEIAILLLGLGLIVVVGSFALIGIIQNKHKEA